MPVSFQSFWNNICKLTGGKPSQLGCLVAYFEKYRESDIASRPFSYEASHISQFEGTYGKQQSMKRVKGQWRT